MFFNFLARRRAAREERELLASVPSLEAHDLAYLLYGQLSVCTQTPSGFEYAARAWLALGELRLPPGSRPMPDLLWQHMPKPLCETEFDWDETCPAEWDDHDPDWDN